MVSRPPAIRPTAPPATLIAAYTPIARLRGGPSGKVVAISASAAAAMTAAPAPCTARAASSHVWQVANPPASDAAENRAVRRRNLPAAEQVPARPPSSSSPPKASA